MTLIIKDPDPKNFNYTLDSLALELSALVDKLFEETNLNRHQVGKKRLKLILLNLILYKGSKVLVSRHNNFKGLALYNGLDAGVTAIKTVTDELEKSESIHFITGKNLPYGNGIRSSIQATSALSKLLDPSTPQLAPPALVLFSEDKESGSKKLID